MWTRKRDFSRDVLVKITKQMNNSETSVFIIEILKHFNTLKKHQFLIS